MPARARSQRTIDEAIKRAPMTIAKQHRGQTPRRERKSFQAYTVSQLLERCDPRQVLVDLAAMPTETLMAKAGCSYLEAAAERRLCAMAALPYLCSKMPVQIDMKSTRAIHLNIVDERQYQELVEVAATDQQPDDGSFSLQMLPTNSAEQSSQSPAEPPAPTPPPRQERALSWDITPSKDGSQRKNVTRLDAVTPPAGDAPAGGYLKSENQWWDSVNGARRQPLGDVPAAPGRASWERTDHGIWAPEKPK